MKIRKRKKSSKEISTYPDTKTSKFSIQCCRLKPKSILKKESDRLSNKQESGDYERYRQQLIELRDNIRSFSGLIKPDTIGLSDCNVRVGESSPNAKYTNHEIELCLNMRIDGISLKEISRKMEIPVRTLRDIFSGKRRAVLPTKFR